jgi:hypothetical protein
LSITKEGRGYDAYDLWDLGEFNQKGSIKTRWGTKDELVRASAVAQQYGIDILVDAVLNVGFRGLILEVSVTYKRGSSINWEETILSHSRWFLLIPTIGSRLSAAKGLSTYTAFI